MHQFDPQPRSSRLFQTLLAAQQSPYRWVLAALAFAAAFLLRYALDGRLPSGFPFLTFFPAVILIAFVSGILPGIAVAAASALASWYFFIAPFNDFGLSGASALALAFFIVIVTVDLAVIHYMFRWMVELDDERRRSREMAGSRDLLFKEMQHRISNNLSVAAALLRMQQRTVREESAKRALDDASRRLALISKMHRSLHDPDGQQLAFGVFVRDLCKDLLDASGMGGRLVCDIRADEIYLPSESAVPIALITAEIVSNAIEHAFDGRDRGRILVEVRGVDDEIRLTVDDDGNGLPVDFDFDHATSLGLVVARQLSRQVGGALTAVPGGLGGARFELVLPRG